MGVGVPPRRGTCTTSRRWWSAQWASSMLADGTHLLAVFTLVAHGIGWDACMVDPKQIDHTLFFPHVQRAGTTSDAHRCLLIDALARARTGADRPLLVTIDLAQALDYVACSKRSPAPPPTSTSTSGSSPARSPSPAFTRYTWSGTGSRCSWRAPPTWPQLFAVYIRDGDHTDIDYRRFLRFAEPVTH